MIIASLLLALQTVPQVQTPPPTTLDDVVVEAQRTREAAETFTRSIAAPLARREVAAWRGPVCVGASGLPEEAAQFLVDRISDWAGSVNLTIGAPGCRPNIFIMTAADPKAAARELVAAGPRRFRTGAADSDRGADALEAFQSSDGLIRWWHISLPVNENTGAPARRLPGQLPFEPHQITRPSDVGPLGQVVLPSRLSDATRDDLQQVTVIIDKAAFDQANLLQISDYVALVSLVPVDPQADAPQSSILDLFDAAQVQEEMMSKWDRALLNAVYSTYQNRSATDANLSLIAAEVARQIRATNDGNAAVGGE